MEAFCNRRWHLRRPPRTLPMQAEFAEGGDLFRDTNLDNCLCSIPDETSGREKGTA